ncbi:recombination mediator RecR [Patescibacteria group bacterium]
MYPLLIQKLIDLFSKFPTVGPRTASRFVFYLLRLPKKEFDDLISTVSNIRNNIKICRFCSNIFEGGGSFCSICSNPGRDKNLLCVVEKENDLVSLEKTKGYNGIYFILGGTVSKLKKNDTEKIKAKELEKKIKSPKNFGLLDASFKEIILALNPTTEGEATALYLERLLKPLNLKITRLGRGLPTGAELEYADDETLKAAFEGRK